MAQGTVWYWNGISGWIKQSGVELLPTVQAFDIMLLHEYCEGMAIVQNCTVSFDILPAEPWTAHNVVVTG